MVEVLDAAALWEVGSARHDDYVSAEPFPHIVLDGLLPEAMLDRVLELFPDPDSVVWKEYDNYFEGKLETQGEERLDPELSQLLYQFNAAPFLRFLEALTGINGLIGDPYYSGGGLHQITTGGRLGIHADFAQHSTLPLERRLNVLIYLNRDWNDEWGGQLELWDREMTACQRRIAPIYNRMVVFTTTDWTFHGHPDPLETPPGVSRKSIALYYFTVGRPAGEIMPGKGSTLFLPRPGESLPPGVGGTRDTGSFGLKEDRWSAVATPPVRAPVARSRRARTVDTIRKLTPPILFDPIVERRKRRRDSAKA